MKAVKYGHRDTKKINLGTKHIYKYPIPTKKFDIARMVVNGRHPQKENHFILEHGCQFVMYVIKGKGKYHVGDEIFNVKKGDVVFVPTNTKFAVAGKLEYITFDVPAFYPEQSEEIEIKL